MKPDRYRNCFIGKEGTDVRHPLYYNEVTGRYTCKAFMQMGLLPAQLAFTADEIDQAFFVYDKDGNYLNNLIPV